MSKKQVILFILVTVLLAWLFNLFVGRFLTAKLSTLPVLNRMQFLSPQAPIVINNKETIRVSDSGDVVLAVAGIKSKVSAVVNISQNTVQTVGSALNLTSNGDFVTGNATFSKTGGDFYVVLNDGRSAKIISKQTDPASSLIFFKASIDNVPTINFGNSADILPGDKVVFIQKSVQSFSGKAYLATVNSAQTDVAGIIFESDFVKRGFITDISMPVVSGEAVVNTKGEVVGVYNGSRIVSSDALKQVISTYFKSLGNIVRPSFGFSYRIITASESQLLKTVQGLSVRAVSNPSPANSAGLIAGDLIIQIGDQKLKEDVSSEEILQQYSPGDKVVFKILRKNQTFDLTLTVAKLK